MINNPQRSQTVDEDIRNMVSSAFETAISFGLDPLPFERLADQVFSYAMNLKSPNDQFLDGDFARILRTPEGRQVLVYGGMDENGLPDATIVMEINGTFSKIVLEYDNDTDAEEATELRDRFISEFSTEDAKKVEKMMVEIFEGNEK